MIRRFAGRLDGSGLERTKSGGDGVALPESSGFMEFGDTFVH